MHWGIDKLAETASLLIRLLFKLGGCGLFRMDEAMEELAPGNKITMKLSEDGSGKGAAIVAAVACRLQASGEYK